LAPRSKKSFANARPSTLHCRRTSTWCMDARARQCQPMRGAGARVRGVLRALAAMPLLA
jgi:hypothetical protein